MEGDSDDEKYGDAQLDEAQTAQQQPIAADSQVSGSSTSSNTSAASDHHQPSEVYGAHSVSHPAESLLSNPSNVIPSSASTGEPQPINLVLRMR